jgi:leader peptidase (prepilin peptidase)/N-methyltransferase
MLAFTPFLFIMGTFIGSVLGVLVDRLPKNKSILGRSHCDYCKKTLSPLDLVPIISYFVLQGKCRYCKKPLSIFYPSIEIITGLIFVFSYLASQGEVLQTVYYLIITSGLIVIFFADLKHGIIPDKVLLVLFTASLIYLLPKENLLNNIISAFIALGFFLMLFVITKGRGMGAGDVKFAAVLGFILGIPGIILSLYLSFLTGSIASIILVLWGKKKLRGDTISFGPFMVIGTFLSMFFSKNIMPLLLPFFAR